jgi:hypothetical protein
LTRSPIPRPETEEIEETETYLRKTKGRVTDIYFKKSMHHLESIDETKDRQYLFKIPNTQSTLSLLSSTTTVDWEQLNNVSITSSAIVPSYTDGWLPATRYGSSMETTTPTAIAWGLQAAVAAKDIYTTTLILRHLTTLAVRYGWIDATSTQLQLVDQFPSFFGFEHLLSVYDRNTHSRYKEVAPNALLGIAICKALEFLQDRDDYGKYVLRGVYYDFEDILRLVLRGLALFCAGAVSSSTLKVAYKEEFGYYSHDIPSLTSTLFCDIFLNSYLNYDDNPSVYFVASQLHYYLINIPISLNTFAYFRDTSNLSMIGQEHPTWVLDTSTLTTDVELYIHKALHMYRMAWSLYFADYTVFKQSFQAYEDNRRSLIDRGIDYIDRLGCSVFLTLNRVQQQQEWESLDKLYEDVGLAQSDLGDYNGNVIPVWCITTLEAIETLNPVNTYVKTVGFNNNEWVTTTTLDLKASYIQAGLTTVLTTLKAMMPSGDNWFSFEKVDDIKSNIGSLLYSESCIYAMWYLNLLRLQQAVSPLTAVGRDETVWFEALTNMPPYLTSLTRRRSILQTILNTQTISSPIEKVEALISTIQPDCTVTKPVLPSYNAYISGDVVTESRSSFSQELTTPGDYFTVSEYMPCVYKRVNRQWVPRVVAGLPRLNLPAGYVAITQEEYLEQGGYKDLTQSIAVIDGEIYILPLSRYVFSLRVDCKQPASAYLVKLLRSLLPSGVHFYIESSHV